MEGAPEGPRVLSAAQLRELHRQELAPSAAAAAGGRQRAAPRGGPPGVGAAGEDPRWAGMKAGSIAVSRASPAAGTVSVQSQFTMHVQWQDLDRLQRECSHKWIRARILS